MYPASTPPATAISSPRVYSTLLGTARDDAITRMEQNAIEMGADAVVNVRLETSEVTKGASEVIAYGTAVRLD